FGLIVSTLLADYLLSASGQGLAAMLITAAKWLPLLILGLLLKNSGANNDIWFTFLIIPYFCWSVLKGFAPSWAGWLGIMESVLLALLYALAILCARFKKRLNADPN
ncbi:MAG TPA: DUF2069 domain-containing protein, partial [Pseudomonadales bacterium]|nr:DUF2069 domain-containing protein [Pseudomonadales bacterium]